MNVSANWQRIFAGIILFLGLFNAPVQAVEETAAAIAAGFRDPPMQARTRMFWRVFGPAWTPTEIDYQLALLKEAGVGGVMTFFMYPVAVDGPAVHNQQFLSAEFLKTLGYAARRARELGLRFSVAGGTGWPYGGPEVAPSDAAQQIRRVPLPFRDSSTGAIPLPALRSGERIVAVFRGAEDITSLLAAEGATLRAKPGDAPAFLYVTGPTFMHVKRPALGGEGLVLDHYNSAAAERYLRAVFAPMLAAAPGMIESVFCDSLEVYGANWTPDLPGEFQQRRGYPLLPALNNLFDDGSPRSPDVRFDFWRTLAELTESRFTRFVSDWSHERGVKFEMEAYGTPPNPLTAARYLDVPTGEQYEWKGFSLSRLAASGAHLAGRRIIGAEAWTWLGLPNRLGDSLSDLKLASDLHFLSGENDLTGVDFAYSPRSAGAPGWLPYYGPALSQNNPQWPWFHLLMDYTSRCQWLLRQGKPVASVAIHLPVEDKFAFGPVDQMLLGFELRDHFASGEKTGEFGLQTALRHYSDLIHGLLMNGFNYDGIDFFSMNRLAAVREGRLVAGDGDYSILILPRLVGIEAEALEKITAFCQSGGTVIALGRLPERIYGTQSPDQIRRTRALLGELFGEQSGSNGAWSRVCGRGKVKFLPDEKTGLSEALREFRPDVSFDPQQPDIGFVHRQTSSLDLYFLANTSEQPRVFQADFATRMKPASLWDPMNGTIHSLPAAKNRDGSMRAKLELPARGSICVVFGASAAPGPAFATPIKSEELKPVWHLDFQGTNAPASRSLTNLTSWTGWLDARFFSGNASYTSEFNWDHSALRRAWLVFSEVREVADVTINGHRAGAAWTAPYEVEITPWLKPGINSLAITVANLPLNLFLGLPDEDLRPLQAAYGDRFPAPEEKRVVREPAPSGLMGPVTIRFSAQ